MQVSNDGGAVPSIRFQCSDKLLEITLAPVSEAQLNQCLFLGLFLLRQGFSVVDDLLSRLPFFLQIFRGVIRPCLAYGSGDLVQFLERGSTP